jgi:hypothetical protein
MFMHVLMIVVMIVVVVMIMCMFVIVIMMVFMGKIIADLLLAIDHNRHMGSFDAALERLIRFHFDTRDIQAVHFLNKGLLINQFTQGSHQHIAGGAHVAFKI